jgi:hypothetical protein
MGLARGVKTGAMAARGHTYGPEAATVHFRATLILLAKSHSAGSCGHGEFQLEQSREARLEPARTVELVQFVAHVFRRAVVAPQERLGVGAEVLGRRAEQVCVRSVAMQSARR